MMRTAIVLLLTAGLACLGACGGDKPATEPTADAGGASDELGHDHSAGPHGGALVASADHAAHFEILHDAEGSRVLLYVLDADIKPVSADGPPVLNLVGEDGSLAVKGKQAAGKTGTEDAWIFAHESLAEERKGKFRVRVGGKSYGPAFEPAHGAAHDHADDDGHEHEGGDHDGHGHDEDDHGHEAGDHDGHGHDEDDHGHEDGDHDGHDHDGEEHEGHDKAADIPRGSHGGVLAAFDGGWLEVKLHDDKGDIELWLTKDKAMKQPFDLPVDTKIKIKFLDMGDKQVELAVRNRVKNEDEDGVANLRETGTNYFIFPGDTGADSKWLCGGDFEAAIDVSFEHGGKLYEKTRIALVPHQHGAGGHDHDPHEGHEHK